MPPKGWRKAQQQTKPPQTKPPRAVPLLVVLGERAELSGIARHHGAFLRREDALVEVANLLRRGYVVTLYRSTRLPYTIAVSTDL